MENYENLGIADLNNLYITDQLTPTQVVKRFLDRIEKLEPKLGAFELILADQALKVAEGAEKLIKNGHLIGPFHGIPFVLKDLIHVKGSVTTGGTNFYAERVSTDTASIAQRLISGGGILLGKTKTVEVALGPWGTNTQRGTPWNPWDKKNHRAPGGSSSGTGAAVAAGLTTCGVGTDTGGSVRIPSAFCGLSGLKVTENKLPVDGIQPLSHTLDTPGPMCRSVIDTGIMYQTMMGREPMRIQGDLNCKKALFKQITSGLEGVVLGVLSEQERSIVDNEILELYDSGVKHFKELGAVIKPLHLPRTIDEMRSLVSVIIAVEGYYYHRELYENSNNAVDEDVKARIIEGKTVMSAEYVQALHQRLLDREIFQEAMDGMAAFITPTLPIAAPIVDEIDQKQAPSQFTRLVNYLGFCALSTPMGLTTKGLPAGLHIVGLGGAETNVLRLGMAFEHVFGDIGQPRGWD